MLLDRFDRGVGKLRISVTDRCDLRCVYCMPAEGLKWKSREEVLTFEEITHLTRIFVGLGVSEIRLTGGEPLVRNGLPTLVRLIRDIEGVHDIGMTTNGIQLDKYARPLRDAGLDRINVSLDTLDRERFHELTRRDAFDRVLRGLEAATEVFPAPVKVNVVAMRGKTEQEVFPFCELAQRRNLFVRFIEFMPLDADEAWSRDDVLTGARIREMIRSRYELVPYNPTDRHAPAREFRFADGPGGVGFIDSVSEPFCEACDRVRITADGKLRTCLFSIVETDLRDPLRGGATDDQLAAMIKDAVWRKEPGHRINEADFVRASRSMSQIGG